MKKMRKFLLPFAVMAMYIFCVILTVQANSGGSQRVYSTSVSKLSIYTGSTVVSTSETVTITNIPADEYDVIDFSTYQVIFATYDYNANAFEYHLTSWALDALVSATPGEKLYTSEAEAIADIQQLVNGAAGVYTGSIYGESVKYTPSVFAESVGQVTTEQNTIVNTLAAYIASHSVTEYGTDPLWTVATPNTSDTVTTASAKLPVGSYLVIPSSSDMAFMNMLVSVDATSAGGDNKWEITARGAVLKGNKNAITKTVKETNITEDSDASTDVQIGEDVTYTITANVPTFSSDSTNEVIFMIVDEPTNLEIDTNSIRVYGVDDAGNETELAPSTGTGTAAYTVDYTNGVLTIDFSDYYLGVFVKDNIYPYTTVKITYNAELLSTAYINTGNENTATLFYGDSNHAINYAEASTNVYTYELVLTKWGTDGKTLSDAGFTIKLESGSEIEFIKDGSTYIVADSYNNSSATPTPTSTPTTTVTTGSDGTLTIVGLDANKTYVIEEIIAPSGYSLNTNVLYFTIIATNPGETTLTVSPTEYITSVSPTVTPEAGSETWTSSVYTKSAYVLSVAKVYVQSIYATSIYKESIESYYSYITLSLNDTKIPSMPSTGSVGIIIFAVVGVFLMVVAVCMMYPRGKGKEKEPGEA